MIEQLIVSRLIQDDDFARRALPNMRREYFRSGDPERIIFEIVEDFVSKYSSSPTPEAVAVELSNRNDISEESFRASAQLLDKVASPEGEPPKLSWMLDQAEQFCQDRAIHLALSKSLEILKDSGEKGVSRGSIPKLLQEALSVTFNPKIGSDYFEDADQRFSEYHVNPKRIPFDLVSLNRMTRGGLLPKTLNVVMAVSGAGKSLFMCHCAAANLSAGLNVLYVTLELSDRMVESRIDANLMGVDMGDLGGLTKETFDRKIADIKSKTTGKLIVQEYSNASTSHFRHLLSELSLKKSFRPDVIYVDYINLCQPAGGRVGNMNSYEKVKLVSEELRHIAIDFGVPVVSATQTNRAGYDSSSVGMDNVSDSIGLPMTADLFFALIQNEQLQEQGRYKIVQLKSRYDDKGKMPHFEIGVNKSQMRLFDLSDQAYGDLEKPASPGIVLGKTGMNFSGFS